MAAIWLILTILERFLVKKKSVSISEKTPLEVKKDYITEIYNSKVGDTDVNGNSGSNNGNDI